MKRLLLTVTTFVSLISFSLPAMAATNPDFDLQLTSSMNTSGNTINMTLTSSLTGASDASKAPEPGLVMFGVFTPPEVPSLNGTSTFGSTTCGKMGLAKDQYSPEMKALPSTHNNYIFWACVIELSNRSVFKSRQSVKLSATATVATAFSGTREIIVIMSSHGDEKDYETTFTNIATHGDTRKAGTNNVKVMSLTGTVTTPQPTAPPATVKQNSTSKSKRQPSSNTNESSSTNEGDNVEVLSNAEEFELDDPSTYSKIATGKTSDSDSKASAASSINSSPAKTQFGVISWAKSNFLKVFLVSFAVAIIFLGVWLAKSKLNERKGVNDFAKNYKVKFGR